MHGILRLLSDSVLDLLRLARLFDFGSRSGGGSGRGAPETTTAEAGGAGK
jgi:hypothetical protein